MTREMETWLSDSRVGNNSVEDDGCRLSTHIMVTSYSSLLQYWTKPSYSTNPPRRKLSTHLGTDVADSYNNIIL